MAHKYITISFLASWLLLTLPAFAADEPVEDDHHWGIGLQGNAPLWGGLSVKYMGLGRLHLQAVEHYVQSGDEYSALVGLQTPITVARYPWTRVYIAPGVGLRKTKEIQTHFVSPAAQIPGEEPVPASPNPIERSVVETTVGGAVLVGLELFLDNIFSSSENSRYGFNIEFGQGIGQVDRTAECEDSDGNPVDCEDFSELDYLRNDSDQKEGTQFRASFVVGFGFHIYF